MWVGVVLVWIGIVRSVCFVLSAQSQRCYHALGLAVVQRHHHAQHEPVLATDCEGWIEEHHLQLLGQPAVRRVGVGVTTQLTCT